MCRRLRFLLLPLVLSLLTLLLVATPVAADIQVLETQRVTAAGDQPDGNSLYPTMSADGETIVYQSSATNQLVLGHFFAGDTNGVNDIFSYDVTSGAINRVSVGSGGNEANGHSTKPSISGDGGLIAYQSSASNLVIGDSNGADDIFAYDVASGLTTRVSVNSAGYQASGGSSMPAVSGDGGTIAFVSGASNLVTGDSNGLSDVFIHDVTSGMTTRVSVSSIGEQSNGSSSAPAISDDGHLVVFESTASNLVVGDSNGVSDVFVHNTTTGITVRVSVDSSGEQATSASSAPAICASGEIIVFESTASNLVSGDTNGKSDVFMHNTTTDATTRVSVDSSGEQANGASNAPSISADGSTVAFSSYGSDLVDGDTNGAADVFVYDIATASTTRVSIDSDGDQAEARSDAPSLAEDGAVVTFHSWATDLVEADTNGKPDVFVRDTEAETTRRVAIGTTDFASGDADISVDGNWITFVSGATNLVPGDSNGTSDIFAYNVATGAITLVSVDSQGYQANHGSDWPVVSSNGSVVAYQSVATNLVPGDTNDGGYAGNGWSGTDVFMFDMASSTTTRVSVDSHGGQANAESYAPSISADGGTIVYRSNATNLVSGDTNGGSDVFAYDVATGTTTRVSVSSSGQQADGVSYSPVISADGDTVVFESSAANLVTGDTNGRTDVFAHNLVTGVTTRVSVNGSGGQANGDSLNPSVSADGEVIAYESMSTNLAGGLPGGFVYNVTTGTVTRFAGNEMYGELYVFPEISADGSTIVFESLSEDLVPNDTNGESDVFAYDIASGQTLLVSVASSGTEADWYSTVASVSGDGSRVVYHSYATNLVSNDTNGVYDVFLTKLGSSINAHGFTTTVAEDVALGTKLGTVTGNSSKPLSFEITAGNDDGFFKVGATSGVVTTAKLLDYETQSVHALTVTVGDGSSTDHAAVTVHVTDVDESTYNPFDDDDGSIFENDIEWLALTGITKGCGTRLFCPKQHVTRGQMAAFLTRALDLPATTVDFFTDDETSIFEDAINRLAASGITKGCGPAAYCPEDTVTRGQMAAFLVRGLGYTDNGGGDLFTDDDTSIFENDIDRLATAGVTKGCNPPANTQFCPNDRVTREQMAAFLRRALG